jgi:hypothetical protein
MSAGVELLRSVGARLVLAAAAAAPLAGTPLTAAAQVDAGPYVPSPSMIVDEMLALGAIRADDYLIDLGSGDGRIPITAARRFGARGFGVDIKPELVKLANENAARAGVADKVRFERRDLFETDLSQATVVTLYLLPGIVTKLVPKILAEMKPGTRVVSHAFTMDDWQADQTDNVEGRTAYMWIVPARVEGTWRWNVAGSGPKDYELMLRQQYQQVEGVVRLDDKMGQLRNVKLSGDQITFSVVEMTSGNPIQRNFTGRITGNSIDGTVKHPGGEAKWTATRQAK